MILAKFLSELCNTIIPPTTPASDRQLAVDFHLTVRPGLTVEECHRIEHDLATRVGQRMGTAKVNIHCEPAKRDRLAASPAQ